MFKMSKDIEKQRMAMELEILEADKKEGDQFEKNITSRSARQIEEVIFDIIEYNTSIF